MESQQTPEILAKNRIETEVTNLGTDVDLLKALYKPNGQKNLINTLNKQFPTKP